MNSTPHSNVPPAAKGPAPFRKRSGSKSIRVVTACTIVLSLCGVAGFLVLSDRDGKKPARETGPRAAPEKSRAVQAHTKTPGSYGHTQTRSSTTEIASVDRPVSALEDARGTGLSHREESPSLAF